jgi:hypothetical protein
MVDGFLNKVFAVFDNVVQFVMFTHPLQGLAIHI